jgi:ribonucleoside-diphosphate reductase alpha chain
MFVSRAVLSGNKRRSASICLFSADDDEMIRAKTGSWMLENPQRTACNNSVVLFRATSDEALFRRLFEIQKEFGEPGFYFSDDPDYGCNPCGEAGLHPVMADAPDGEGVKRLRELGYTAELPPKARLSGWQMCNLTTINGAVIRDPRDFYRSCVHAAVIGTLQAAYTDMPYLGAITRAINERDALLGVSICGFMDNPELLFAPRLLERGARICRATNQLIAAALGTRPAARVTCVKPEGTASLLLGTAAGIHPRHARRYFRRIQADRRDPVYQRFRTVNAHMTEPSQTRPATDDVIVFPVEAPADAIVRNQIGAVEFLTKVLLVQKHWVCAGEAPAGPSPGLHHNVSHTCAVRPHEWPAVADFIWEHRAEFSGITLFGDVAAERYPDPSLHAVVTEGDEARWNQLRYHLVDYTALRPSKENHELEKTAECVGGVCEE